VTQRTGRITCPKCGANNFDSVTTCWKCGAQVNTSTGSHVQASPAAASYTPGAPAAQYGYTPERIPSQVQMSQPTGDPNVANRAAIWLALTLPFIGLPAGWLFMMVEDQRKQRVGRICVMWSLIALVFHILFTVILLKSATSGLVSALGPLINSMASKQAGGSGAGSGIPGD